MGSAKQRITRTTIVRRNKVTKGGAKSSKSNLKSKRCPSCGRYI